MTDAIKVNLILSFATTLVAFTEAQLFHLWGAPVAGNVRAMVVDRLSLAGYRAGHPVFNVSSEERAYQVRSGWLAA